MLKIEPTMLTPITKRARENSLLDAYILTKYSYLKCLTYCYHSFRGWSLPLLFNTARLKCPFSDG